MTTSQAGYDLIRHSEGFAAHVYNDNGKQAIGYGHDLLPGEDYAAGIDILEADTLLTLDVTTRFEPVLNDWLATHNITPTQGQYDALIDFEYNLGPGNLLTMLGHGWDQVPLQIMKWNHVNKVENVALTARRQAELNLWNQA